MPTEIRPGEKLRSVVDSTEILVVKGLGEIDIRCGGVPMARAGEDTAQGGNPDPALQDGTQMGKRYQSEDGTLEVLCVRPGQGSLTVGEQLLATKSAKALPASD